MYSHVLMLLQYIVPTAVLLFTYTKIGIVIWCHRIPGEAENSRDQRIAKSKKKVGNTKYIFYKLSKIVRKINISIRQLNTMSVMALLELLSYKHHEMGFFSLPLSTVSVIRITFSTKAEDDKKSFRLGVRRVIIQRLLHQLLLLRRQRRINGRLLKGEK